MTLRVAGLDAIPDCVTPSDHVTLHGAVPVKTAWIVVDAPVQIDAEPLTVAVDESHPVVVPVNSPLGSLTIVFWLFAFGSVVVLRTK